MTLKEKKEWLDYFRNLRNPTIMERLAQQELATIVKSKKGGRSMAKKECWQIKNVEGEVDDETGKPLYWSNAIGWVDKGSADKIMLTDAQKKRSNPPIHGKLVRCSKGAKRRKAGTYGGM